MGIIYCEKDRTFTLQTKETTYQMQVDQYGFLLHLYYGKKAEGCMDYLLTYYDRGFHGLSSTGAFLLRKRRFPQCITDAGKR